MVSDTIDGEVLRPRLSQRTRERAAGLSASASLADVALAPFWVLGWLAFWTCLVVAATLRLSVAAAGVGWLDARALAGGAAGGRWPVTARKARRGSG